MDFTSSMAVGGYSSSLPQSNYSAWGNKDKHTGSGVVSGTQGYQPVNEGRVGGIKTFGGIDNNLSSIFQHKAEMAKNGLGGTNDGSGHSLFTFA